MDSRVLVAGAGAIGSVVGGLLARAGAAVTFLGRPAHLSAIGRSGLALEGIWGRSIVRGLELATDASSLKGSYDLILLTVKSYDTEVMLSRVVSRLAADGALISLQNGLGNVERVAATVGLGRALGGRVIFGAEIPRPGAVRVTVCADRILIGAAEPNNQEGCKKARFWAEQFAAAGLPCAYTANIEAALWGKVLYNAPLNALGALLAVPYGELGKCEAARAIMDKVIDEAFAVAAANGISLPWQEVASYRRLFYQELLPSTQEHRSSMLQDLERGRSTEIDAINGQVEAHGARVGVPTPVNTVLKQLIHLVERLGRTGKRGGS